MLRGQGLGDTLNTSLSQDLEHENTESPSFLFPKQQPLYPPSVSYSLRQPLRYGS